MHATRKIIHIDMDAFFASVEQLDSPNLRGKPIAVGHSRERGVVAAASYEARKYGVHSAMSSLSAKIACPDLIFVPVRFHRYKEISMEIRDIFYSYSPLVEPLSLDEAYLDVTDHMNGFVYACDIATEIRNRIYDEVGLTASAGISYCKFLAKMASDQRKPNGQYVIHPERGREFVSQLPVGKFHGIGPATAKKMISLGIRTGADLSNRSEEFLKRQFGKNGGYYYELSRGNDFRAVNADRERKSSGAETTFSHDLVNEDDLFSAIRSITSTAWSRCNKNQVEGRTATLKIKYNDFQQITRSKSLPNVFTNLHEFEDVLLSLAESLLPLSLPIRLVGVTMSGFVDDENEDSQLNLFV